MNIEMMKIKDITPYEKNAKKHNRTQIENVAESIKRFGFAQPLVVDKDNVLIIGHCRLLASKLLQIREVPVVKMENLTDEEVKQLRLLDNKLNESEWDIDLLSEELKELDMSGFDIDWELPEEEPEPEIIEDDLPEEVEPVCQKGDLWQLGDHRLICGDSTDPEIIKRLMGGEKADLLLTDPPYNVSLGQNAGHPLRPSEAKQLHRRTDGLVIANDAWKNDEDFINFLIKAFTTALGVMKPGGVFYIWYADTQALNFRLACQRAGMTIRENLIWVKNSFAFGRQDYQWQHEPCLYGWKDGASHYFIDKRNLATIIEDQVDLDKMKKEDMKKLLEVFYSEEFPTTIMRAPKPTYNELHPTMKPLKLMAKQINNSTKPGEAVLDIFGGSGSTMMAAEQLNRRAFTCELDQHYADVIIQRWEDFTGRKAEKING